MKDSDRAHAFHDVAAATAASGSRPSSDGPGLRIVSAKKRRARGSKNAGRVVGRAAWSHRTRKGKFQPLDIERAVTVRAELRPRVSSGSRDSSASRCRYATEQRGSRCRGGEIMSNLIRRLVGAEDSAGSDREHSRPSDSNSFRRGRGDPCSCRPAGCAIKMARIASIAAKGRGRNLGWPVQRPAQIEENAPRQSARRTPSTNGRATYRP